MRQEKNIKRRAFFVGVFRINLPIPKAIRKMARVPIKPEMGIDIFSFLIQGMV